ncbi:MAG: M23 family metallopeptidase [Vampirovibrionales bacterium]
MTLTRLVLGILLMSGLTLAHPALGFGASSSTQKSATQVEPHVHTEVKAQEVAMIWDRFKAWKKGGTIQAPTTPGTHPTLKPSIPEASASSSAPRRTPSQSIQITSPFGWRTHPVTQKQKFHTGIDIAASTGTPIRAILPGMVVFSGIYGGYGNAVVLQHGPQHYTLYGHASQLLVTVGTQVNAGQEIALVGATGVATGPHLHFEVRLEGVFQDPMPYLKAIQQGKNPVLALKDPLFMAQYTASTRQSKETLSNFTPQRIPTTPTTKERASQGVATVPIPRPHVVPLTKPEGTPQNWMMQEAWEPGQEALDIAPETAETPKPQEDVSPVPQVSSKAKDPPSSASETTEPYDPYLLKTP